MAWRKFKRCGVVDSCKPSQTGKRHTTYTPLRQEAHITARTIVSYVLID